MMARVMTLCKECGGVHIYKRDLAYYEVNARSNMCPLSIMRDKTDKYHCETCDKLVDVVIKGDSDQKKIMLSDGLSDEQADKIIIDNDIEEVWTTREVE